MDIENSIHAAPMKPIHRSELICISKLVFYSGIKMGEIGKLTVRDMIDQSGGVRDAVEKFEKQLPLNTEAKNAIERYYAEMKRQRPTQTLRRRLLFPSYQNPRTLSRHWMKVNTGYAEIREAGIKYHFASSQAELGTLGGLYKKGSDLFRISDRQYQAVVSKKKIPSGTAANDQRCISNLLELSDKAEKLQSKNPTAESDAKDILKEAHKTLNKMAHVGFQGRDMIIV